MATAQYERSGTRASAHPDPDNTNQNHVPRVHVSMVSDPEGLDRILDPESVER